MLKLATNMLGHLHSSIMFRHIVRKQAFCMNMQKVLVTGTSILQSRSYRMNFQQGSHFEPDYKYFENALENQQHIPVLKLMENFLDHRAVIDNYGTFTYRDIFLLSCELASDIMETFGNKKLTGACIGFGLESDSTAVVSLFACWLADAVAYPLFFPGQLKYHDNKFFDHSGYALDLVIANERKATEMKTFTKALQIPLLTYQPEHHILKTRNKFPEISDKNVVAMWREKCDITSVYENKPAILTFRTTERCRHFFPLSHGNVMSRLQTMFHVWEKNDSDDVYLITLFSVRQFTKLIDSLLFPFCYGATAVIQPFNVARIWGTLLGKSNGYRVNKYLDTEKNFKYLMEVFEKMENLDMRKVHNACKDISLCCVLNRHGKGMNMIALSFRWKNATGQSLKILWSSSVFGPICSIETDDRSRVNSKHMGKCALLPGVSARLIPYSQNNSKAVIIGDKAVTWPIEVDEIEGFMEVKSEGRIVKHIPTELSQEIYSDDGWHRCSFQGIYSRNGLLRLTSALDSEWHDNGKNIIHSYLKRIYINHPDIENIELFRRPYHKDGESVLAVVVLKHGASMTVTDLQNYYRGNYSSMSTCFMPSKLVIVPSFPTNLKEYNRRVLLWTKICKYLDS